MRIVTHLICLSWQLRLMLEEEMGVSLRDYRHFIGDQVLFIYGQMDLASLVFDHLLLGSTFNASNGPELERMQVSHIINVTREVDNFFPAEKFHYKNIRVFDDDEAQLLPHWEDTFKFINEAKLVFCYPLIICSCYCERRSPGSGCTGIRGSNLVPKLLSKLGDPALQAISIIILSRFQRRRSEAVEIPLQGGYLSVKLAATLLAKVGSRLRVDDLVNY